MAFDRMTWVSLNRPLTDTERAQRLDVHRPAAQDATDGFSVYSLDDTCVEVCESSYSQIGWGVFIFILAMPVTVWLFGLTIWAMFHTEGFAKSGEQGLATGIAGVGAVFFLLLALVPVWALFRDCFNYTHKPVRFNRQTQMVYAFKHNGPGGVISVPWDKAFFYVQRQARNAMMGGTPMVLRCLVLDDSEKVVDTFSFGKRVVNVSTEATPLGKQTLYQIEANFEFFRRYMEGGPSTLPPVKAYLPKQISMRNSMRVWFQGAREVAETNALLRVLMVVLGGPLVVMSFFHFIAQKTSRDPVWPVDIEAACSKAMTPGLARTSSLQTSRTGESP